MSDVSVRWNDRSAYELLGNSREEKVGRAADKATAIGLATGAVGATVVLAASSSARTAAYALLPRLPKPAGVMAAVAGTALMTAFGGIALSMAFPSIFGE